MPPAPNALLHDYSSNWCWERVSYLGRDTQSFPLPVNAKRSMMKARNPETPAIPRMRADTPIAPGIEIGPSYELSSFVLSRRRAVCLPCRISRVSLLGSFMQRAIISAIVVLAVWIYAPDRTSAQTTYTKEGVAALLQRAVDHANFSPIHAVPLHIIEKIQYTVGSQSVDGVKEILVGHEGRRDAIKVGDMGEIDVLLPGKLYTLRNGVPAFYLRYRIGETERAVYEYLHENPVVKKAEMSQEGQICAELDGELDRHVCFNATSGAIESLTVRTRSSGSSRSMALSASAINLDADHFSDFEGGRYPRHVILETGSERIELTYDTVAEVREFAPDAFAPPAKATAWNWCEGMPTSDKAKIESTEAGISTLGRDTLANPKLRAFLFYVVVGTDGHAERYEPITGGNSYENRVIEKAMKDTRFVTKSCDGKPVEYETYYRFNTF